MYYYFLNLIFHLKIVIINLPTPLIQCDTFLFKINKVIFNFKMKLVIIDHFVDLSSNSILI